MGITNKDRQIFVADVVEKYMSRITGADEERVVGNIPDNVFYVGQLLSVNDEDNVHRGSSKTFINSIGISFMISESEFANAEITLFPIGNLYYRAIPTLEEQRQCFLEEFIKNNPDVQVESFDELVGIFEKQPELFNNMTAKLVPVYKKVVFGRDHFSVRFRPAAIMDSNGENGFIDEQGEINKEIIEHLEDIQRTISDDTEWMSKVVRESSKITDLLTNESYSDFLRINSTSNAASQGQNWKIYFDVSINKRDDKYLISISIINDSTTFKSQSHRKKNNDKYSIETLFNAGFETELNNAHFIPISLDSFADDYKYEKIQYAIGNNCSISFDESKNCIKTENLPIFYQHRLITNDELSIKFHDLCQAPISTLEDIYRKMEVELRKWKDYQQSKDNDLTPVGKQQMEEEIRGFQDEIRRFKFGIEVIKNHSIVKQSFVQMNHAFLNSSKKYDTWRLFQIVFIVSMIPDIVACDPNVMQDEVERNKTTLPYMSLLYFPTGGGKTEAFLGVLVFNLFFDRHRGKSVGVTSILRYPLRLLSVQQVQRLANILAQAELIRRDDPTIASSFPFSLGYYVGDNNTANRLSDDDYDKYESMEQPQRDESRIVDVCPFCREKTVHIKVDRERRRLIHYCNNPKCKSGGELELYIIDTEIYRYLPSAIISTVDKMAIMGANANFRNILNGATHMCPMHGFTSKSKCIEKGCDIEVQNYMEIDMYDPAPTLFIQDELHLIRESLGTYASHYESFIKYYIKNVSKSHRDIKVIGATATISSYREQVYHLYMREPIMFPCASIYQDRNFYSHIDYDDLQRTIIGYAPFGKAIVNSVVFSIQYMREVIDQYHKDPQKVLRLPGISITTEEEALALVEDYWIFLEYNNVKRDGNNVEGALETPVNVELSKKGIKEFVTRKMTGDETFQDVREVLAEVENSKNIYDGLNMIIATSMISHGVDADRFNNMFFYGIPGNMAEYIQAYSRTGRRYPSIVVDIIRPTRETDMSFLRNFVSMHKYKDMLIEAVPINRWASKAITNTLPGIFASLLLQKYDKDLQYTVGTLFQMKNIKKAIELNALDKNTIINEMIVAYGCEDVSHNADDLGNRYKEKIREFINYIFGEIQDKVWENQSIFQGFSIMNCRIMNSLRDTDSQLFIEME